MAEMLYLFEERLIHRFHTEGPGKSARAEAEQAAIDDASFDDLSDEEINKMEL